MSVETWTSGEGPSNRVVKTSTGPSFTVGPFRAAVPAVRVRSARSASSCSMRAVYWNLKL